MGCKSLTVYGYDCHADESSRLDWKGKSMKDGLRKMQQMTIEACAGSVNANEVSRKVSQALKDAVDASRRKRDELTERGEFMLKCGVRFGDAPPGVAIAELHYITLALEKIQQDFDKI